MRWLPLVALLGCDPAVMPPVLAPAVDGAFDAARLDAALLDAALLDAAPVDAALLDAALLDAAAPDRGAPDAVVDASLDAQPADALARDAGPPDAQPPDAGPAVDRCAEVRGFGPQFADVIDRWAQQDAADPLPEGAVVFVGSSSIRRWEALQVQLGAFAPRQRGVGGAQLGEIALFADALINAHAPRAVVLFAGTNDLAVGVPPGVVIERLRCLRQRLSPQTPLIFVGITPTPARWMGWPAAAEVNAGVAALAKADPQLIYLDTPAEFLATGAPPDDALFADDRLHLSAAGYAIWAAQIGDALAALLDPVPPAVGGLAPGTRLLIDLGPSNPEDGEPTPSPDHLGQHWNNWHPLDGGGAALPGEHRGGLVDATGRATAARLTIAGGFLANGRRNGGLLWPAPERLGDLAVGSATGDYLYVDGDDNPGALLLEGLTPGALHTVRLFASRADPERRITRYVLHGETVEVVELQTSGAGAGADGGNDGAVAEARVAPDAWGRVVVDVGIGAGRYGYLALIEISAP